MGAVPSNALISPPRNIGEGEIKHTIRIVFLVTYTFMALNLLPTVCAPKGT